MVFFDGFVDSIFNTEFECFLNKANILESFISLLYLFTPSMLTRKALPLLLVAMPSAKGIM